LSNVFPQDINITCSHYQKLYFHFAERKKYMLTPSKKKCKTC